MVVWIYDIRGTILLRKCWNGGGIEGYGLLQTDSFLSEAFYEKIGVLGRVDRGEYAEHRVERLDDLELR